LEHFYLHWNTNRQRSRIFISDVVLENKASILEKETGLKAKGTVHPRTGHEGPEGE
jgi:hypothetical protein